MRHYFLLSYRRSAQPGEIHYYCSGFFIARALLACLLLGKKKTPSYVPVSANRFCLQWVKEEFFRTSRLDNSAINGSKNTRIFLNVEFLFTFLMGPIHFLLNLSPRFGRGKAAKTPPKNMYTGQTDAYSNGFLVRAQ